MSIPIVDGMDDGRNPAPVGGLSRYIPLSWNYLQCFIVTNSFQLAQILQPSRLISSYYIILNIHLLIAGLLTIN
jgi:hypothetical protein